MKYLIIGTGGIGGSLGGFLSAAGNDVSFIARGKTLEALKSHGLKLKSGIKGELHIPEVKAYTSDEYNEAADVIFLCVKDYSLESVIPVIEKSSNENTIIIPLLNGYGIGQRISKKLCSGKVIDGCIYISAFIEAPGSIIHLGTLFKLVFGQRPGINADPLILKEIKNTLVKCGIDAEVSDKIENEIFKKFSLVSTCAACGTYYDITAGSIQNEKKYRDTFLKLCNEINEIGVKLGFKFKPDLTEINIKSLYTLPPDATSSLYKDMKAGKNSELDSLIFNVVRLGKRLDVETPAYNMIAEHFGYK